MKHGHVQRNMLDVRIVVLLGLVFTLVGCGTNQSSKPSNLGVRASEQTTSFSIGDYAGGSDSGQIAPSLGLIVDAQGRVLDLEAGGAAQQAGIQVGDMLAEVDGVPLAPALAAAATEPTLVYGKGVQAIRSKISEGKLMKIIVKRAQQVITLNVQPTPSPAREGQPTPTAVPQNQLYM